MKMFTMDQIDATHTAYRMGIAAAKEVSDFRIAELEEKAKKAKFRHDYQIKQWKARAAKLERLVEILLENDPDDMAADAVTVLDVWRKEASELMARHARLDARQAGMEQMRADESAEIRTAIRAAAFDKAERFADDALGD
jgi:hypothetical protein